jgi:tetratricopeptide (TPR) repeat protein
MGLFDKLFGKKNKPADAPAGAAGGSEQGDPSKDPNMIKVFDQFGRELFITRQEWVKSVLLPNIKAAWDDPEKLAGFILGGFQDGFISELIEGAERLAAIDTNHERSTVLLAIALLKSNRAGDSERVLRAHMAKHGESGVVLTNLAKVQAEGEEADLTMQTLWHALELDPNQDNAVGWYEVVHREKQGEEAGLEALRRIAALPESWRAQLWLARAALQRRALDEALQLYQESLTNAPRPVPVDLLTQMSGDLGNLGHLPELVNLTAPHFRAEIHGLQVGNNLIKGLLDLGHMDEARSILDQLYAQKRPDWKEHLSFWDTELAKTRLVTQPQPVAEKLEVTLLTVSGPVWLKEDSSAAELFPIKDTAGPSLCFVCASVEHAAPAERLEHQLSDAAGRVSRALPLFFAEQTHWRTDARVSTLIPWVVRPTNGFVVSSHPWSDEQVAGMARQGDEPNEYAITAHLQVQAEPWRLELRLLRTIDGSCLGTLASNFLMASPEAAIPALMDEVLALLQAETGAVVMPPPTAYAVPTGQNFPNYLLRLEQLLATRCSGMDGVQPGFLSGEREIIEGNLHLCLAHPDLLSVRVLFAQTLQTMKRIRPDVVVEFRDKVALLQQQHPLPGAAQGVIDRMLNESTSP